MGSPNLPIPEVLNSNIYDSFVDSGNVAYAHAYDDYERALTSQYGAVMGAQNEAEEAIWFKSQEAVATVEQAKHLAKTNAYIGEWEKNMSEIAKANLTALQGVSSRPMLPAIPTAIDGPINAAQNKEKPLDFYDKLMLAGSSGLSQDQVNDAMSKDWETKVAVTLQPEDEYLKNDFFKQAFSPDGKFNAGAAKKWYKMHKIGAANYSQIGWALDRYAPKVDTRFGLLDVGQDSEIRYQGLTPKKFQMTSTQVGAESRAQTAAKKGKIWDIERGTWIDYSDSLGDYYAKKLYYGGLKLYTAPDGEEYLRTTRWGEGSHGDAVNGIFGMKALDAINDDDGIGTFVYNLAGTFTNMAVDVVKTPVIMARIITGAALELTLGGIETSAKTRGDNTYERTGLNSAVNTLYNALASIENTVDTLKVTADEDAQKDDYLSVKFVATSLGSILGIFGGGAAASALGLTRLTTGTLGAGYNLVAGIPKGVRSVVAGTVFTKGVTKHANTLMKGSTMEERLNGLVMGAALINANESANLGLKTGTRYAETLSIGTFFATYAADKLFLGMLTGNTAVRDFVQKFGITGVSKEYANVARAVYASDDVIKAVAALDSPIKAVAMATAINKTIFQRTVSALSNPASFSGKAFAIGAQGLEESLEEVFIRGLPNLYNMHVNELRKNALKDKNGKAVPGVDYKKIYGLYNEKDIELSVDTLTEAFMGGLIGSAGAMPVMRHLGYGYDNAKDFNIVNQVNVLTNDNQAAKFEKLMKTEMDDAKSTGYFFPKDLNMKGEKIVVGSNERSINSVAAERVLDAFKMKRAVAVEIRNKITKEVDEYKLTETMKEHISVETNKIVKTLGNDDRLLAALDAGQVRNILAKQPNDIISAEIFNDEINAALKEPDEKKRNERVKVLKEALETRIKDNTFARDYAERVLFNLYVYPTPKRNESAFMSYKRTMDKLRDMHYNSLASSYNEASQNNEDALAMFRPLDFTKEYDKSGITYGTMFKNGVINASPQELITELNAIPQDLSPNAYSETQRDITQRLQELEQDDAITAETSTYWQLKIQGRNKEAAEYMQKVVAAYEALGETNVETRVKDMFNASEGRLDINDAPFYGDIPQTSISAIGALLDPKTDYSDAAMIERAKQKADAHIQDIIKLRGVSEADAIKLDGHIDKTDVIDEWYDKEIETTTTYLTNALQIYLTPDVNINGIDALEAKYANATALSNSTLFAVDGLPLDTRKGGAALVENVDKHPKLRELETLLERNMNTDNPLSYGEAISTLQDTQDFIDGITLVRRASELGIPDSAEAIINNLGKPLAIDARTPRFSMKDVDGQQSNESYYQAFNALYESLKTRVIELAIMNAKAYDIMLMTEDAKTMSSDVNIILNSGIVDVNSGIFDEYNEALSEFDAVVQPYLTFDEAQVEVFELGDNSEASKAVLKARRNLFESYIKLLESIRSIDLQSKPLIDFITDSDAKAAIMNKTPISTTSNEYKHIMERVNTLNFLRAMFNVTTQNGSIQGAIAAIRALYAKESYVPTYQQIANILRVHGTLLETTPLSVEVVILNSDGSSAPTQMRTDRYIVEGYEGAGKSTILKSVKYLADISNKTYFYATATGPQRDNLAEILGIGDGNIATASVDVMYDANKDVSKRVYDITGKDAAKTLDRRSRMVMSVDVTDAAGVKTTVTTRDGKSVGIIIDEYTLVAKMLKDHENINKPIVLLGDSEQVGLGDIYNERNEITLPFAKGATMKAQQRTDISIFRQNTLTLRKAIRVAAGNTVNDVVEPNTLTFSYNGDGITNDAGVRFITPQEATAESAKASTLSVKSLDGVAEAQGTSYDTVIIDIDAIYQELCGVNNNGITRSQFYRAILTAVGRSRKRVFIVDKGASRSIFNYVNTSTALEMKQKKAIIDTLKTDFASVDLANEDARAAYAPVSPKNAAVGKNLTIDVASVVAKTTLIYGAVPPGTRSVTMYSVKNMQVVYNKGAGLAIGSTNTYIQTGGDNRFFALIGATFHEITDPNNTTITPKTISVMRGNGKIFKSANIDKAELSKPEALNTLKTCII